MVLLSGFWSDSGLRWFREKPLELQNAKARSRRPGLPLEARKENLAYDSSVGKVPVYSWPAYGADRLDS